VCVDSLLSDNVFIVASSPAWYAPSGDPAIDTTGDTLGRVAPWLVAALDSAMTTGVRDGPTVPRRVVLHPSHPNPFNNSTRVTFELDQPALVELDVFDALGRHVCSLIRAHRQAGEHYAIWDGRIDGGALAASGTFFLRLRAGEVVRSHKITFLK